MWNLQSPDQFKIKLFFTNSMQKSGNKNEPKL